MENTSKTLYIPLYGKAMVSRKGIILSDKKAESIWAQEGFALKGKAKSRWLAYYMAMRAAVMDDWTAEQLAQAPQAVVLHLGCGLDSRCERVQAPCAGWYDVDLAPVIEQRRRYYTEGEGYHMIAADLCSPEFAALLPAAKQAVVVLEGVSMYLPRQVLESLFAALKDRYEDCRIILDVYTRFGVRASERSNPIRTVGASACTGIDVPEELVFFDGVVPHAPLSMTPERFIRRLSPAEQVIFRRLFAGRFADSIYKLFTYTIQ